MSNDFLSEAELAELEAELGDLGMDDEEEGTSEKALEKEPVKAEVTPEPEPESKPDQETSESDIDLDAELEAELNVAEPEAEGLESKPDQEVDEQAMLKAKQAEHEALTRAEHEAKKAQIAEQEKEPDPAVYEADPAPAETEAPEVTYAEPVKNEAEATNTDDDLTDMLLNAGSSFDPRMLQRDLAFNENNLDDAFMSQAGMFAHYSGVAHRAARRYDQLVQQEKLVQAKLDQEYRQQAADDGEKVTEAVIKNRILLDPRHRKIMDRVLDGKAVAAMTKDACDAFKQRRDMLIQVGANVREEHKGDLRMKAARETQDDAKHRALDRMNQA